jgi:hypothetical protein
MGRRKNEQAFASRDMHLNGGSMVLKRFYAPLAGRPGHF